MKNPIVIKWETRLRNILDQLDHYLEEKYFGKFSLKPNRLPPGKGVTRDTDGLFGMSAAFSPGFGSKLGSGYVFNVCIETRDTVSDEFRKQIEDEVIAHLNTELAKEFPTQELKVARDGALIKIYGNLDLN